MDRDLEDRPRDKVMKARQPWWPADRLVSDMALELALTVEQLGLSASPSDWDQVWLLISGHNLCDLASTPPVSFLPSSCPHEEKVWHTASTGTS